jgi:glycosyltransferase involved in cell wall biosynthesis/GT2 family glycosyltransferase
LSATSVIVPTALGGTRLVRLLDSLELERSGAEVIVVDNASGDPGLAELAKRPSVEVLALPRNEGFSRAVNAGIRASSGETLVLLNDDCVCDPGFLAAITGPLDPAAGVVMAAGVMRDAGDPSLIDSAGMELDGRLVVYDYLNGEPLERLADGVPDPVGPSAAAAAFDRAAFVEAGGFDERIFAYWEDVDLVLGIRSAGGRCALAAGAIGTHEHSATLGSGSPRKNYLMGFGRAYVLRKWRALTARRAAPILLREALLCAGQAAFDRNLAGVRGRVAGWRAARGERDLSEAELPVAPARLAADMRRRAVRRRRLRARGTAGTDALGVLHLAEVSGPARCLEPALELFAGRLAVVLPGRGELTVELRRFGDVLETDYRPLTVPRGVLEALRLLPRTAIEVARFLRVIRARRPKVVVVATSMLPAPLIAARIARVPAIAYVAELRTREPGAGALRSLAGRATAAIVRRTTTAAIACSRAAAEPFRQSRGPEVTVIYPPIEERYRDGTGPDFRARHGIEPGAPLLVSVGAITRGRGQDLLIRAAAAVCRSEPGLRVVIVGTPYQREPDLAFAEELRDLVDRLGLEGVVRFAGFEQRVEDAYAAADVFVNPARFEEPFGRAAFEAAVAGCPIVSARVGAVPELLTDRENSLLVPREDVAALAAAIESLLADRELGRALASAASRVARDRLDPDDARRGWSRVIASVAPGARLNEGRAPGG